MESQKETNLIARGYGMVGRIDLIILAVDDHSNI